MPPTNSINQSYDFATIAVDPVEMQAAHDSIQSNAQDVADFIGKIFDTINALKLTWTGNVADSMQTAFDDLDQALKTLFGDPSKTDDPGTMARFLGGLAAAVQNYSGTESQLAKNIADFSTQVGAMITQQNAGTQSPSANGPQTVGNSGPIAPADTNAANLPLTFIDEIVSGSSTTT